jgi:hypothetical protein
MIAPTAARKPVIATSFPQKPLGVSAIEESPTMEIILEPGFCLLQVWEFGNNLKCEANDDEAKAESRHDQEEKAGPLCVSGEVCRALIRLRDHIHRRS